MAARPRPCRVARSLRAGLSGAPGLKGAGLSSEVCSAGWCQSLPRSSQRRVGACNTSLRCGDVLGHILSGPGGQAAPGRAIGCQVTPRSPLREARLVASLFLSLGLLRATLFGPLLHAARFPWCDTGTPAPSTLRMMVLSLCFTRHLFSGAYVPVEGRISK